MAFLLVYICLYQGINILGIAKLDKHNKIINVFINMRALKLSTRCDALKGRGMQSI